MPNLVFVTTGTGIGGAELMLLKLLTRIDRSKFDVSVISLTSTGPVGNEMEKLGIRVIPLEIELSITSLVLGVVKLIRVLRELDPSIVQTWMYHADLLGGLAARLTSRARVVWGIRQSNLDPQNSKKTTIFTMKLCALLSGVIPDRIVCCSKTSMQVHSELGYKAERFEYLPNGFDPEVFQPDSEARQRIREKLEVSERIVLIGNLSRYDPQKDLNTFLRAAAMLLDQRNDVRFVVAGNGMNQDNMELMQQLKALGIQDQSILLGELRDIRDVLHGLDILTVSSAYGEGFPNVVGEAMLTEVTCVVTDVGDARSIVGDCGITIPVRCPEQLCDAWLQVLSMDDTERTLKRKRGRQKIIEEFGLSKVVRLYENLYRNVLERTPSAA